MVKITCSHPHVSDVMSTAEKNTEKNCKKFIQFNFLDKITNFVAHVVTTACWQCNFLKNLITIPSKNSLVN